MSKFFVNNSEKIRIDVHVWEEDGAIMASSELSQVPHDKKEGEIDKIWFDFRKPSYADSSAIVQKSQMNPSEGNINVLSFQDSVFRTLCVGWSLCDDDGVELKVSNRNIDNLEPSLVRSAVEAILAKIRL